MRRLPVLVAALMSLGSPASAQFSDSYQFLKAVREADGTKATGLLNKGGGSVTVNTKDAATGETALHIATKRRDALWVGFLLQRGAQPDLRDAGGATPLMVATQLGWTDGASILLGRRAAVDLANEAGETPLIRAVQQRNLEMVKLLLAAGASARRADTGSGLTARDYAARDPRAAAILREIDSAAPPKRATVGPN